MAGCGVGGRSGRGGGNAAAGAFAASAWFGRSVAVRQELTVSPWNGLQSVDWTPGEDIHALTGARQDIGGSAAHLADERVASEGVTAPVSANREALGPAGMLPSPKVAPE